MAIITFDPIDAAHLVKRLPLWIIDRALPFLHPVLKGVMYREEWQGKIFVAGGLFRSIVDGTKVSDIDLFVTNKSDAVRLKDELCVWCPETDKKKVVETEFAFTLTQFSPAIQIIHRWTYNGPMDVLNAFDFTCCQAVLSIVKGEFEAFCSPDFENAATNFVLQYTQPSGNEIGGTLLRVLKYAKKGYNIAPEEFARVLADYNTKVLGGKSTVTCLLSPRNLAEPMRDVDPLGKKSRKPSPCSCE